MIVVTGSCRSGTSMMMQTLKLLGVEIAGHAFHPDFPVVEGNPKGYFDLPFEELIGGINTTKYKDKAIKILGEWILGISTDDITHIIVCKRRDGGAQDRSTKKLLKIESEIKSTSSTREILLKACLKLSDKDLRERRFLNYHYIGAYLDKFTGYSTEIFFEDMLSETEETITNIKNFLHLDSDVDISKAVDNIGIHEMSGE